MAEREDLTAVVAMPGEIDVMNAEEVTERLTVACKPGMIVVADMTATTFCDTRGTQELLAAHYRIGQMGCELRLAVRYAHMLRMWELMGADKVLAIYPSVMAATAAR
ncbi:MAG TPA: STAS domain-containing protein [Streptosporangiaceae bacterium]|jgi:anti-sigma B factor antagonist|nr:STAS domain-containing protein [Streptosporangiaceae bacterium]